jgi:hypothetical protein
VPNEDKRNQWVTRHAKPSCGMVAGWSFLFGSCSRPTHNRCHRGGRFAGWPGLNWSGTKAANASWGRVNERR